MHIANISGGMQWNMQQAEDIRFLAVSGTITSVLAEQGMISTLQLQKERTLGISRSAVDRSQTGLRCRCTLPGSPHVHF